MAPVIVVPKSAFWLTKGDLKYHAVVGDSGKEVGRGFCASCGSPIATRLAALPVRDGDQSGKPGRARALQAHDEHLYLERAAVGTGRTRVAELRQNAGLIRASAKYHSPADSP